MHLDHKNETLYIPSVLKGMMTDMIWGIHTEPAFLPWMFLIKKTFKSEPSGFYSWNGYIRIKWLVLSASCFRLQNM